MIISLKNNNKIFKYGDLTRFKFENKVIDIHNLFYVLNINVYAYDLTIELESNKFYEDLFNGKRKKGEILRLKFLNYSIDNSYEMKFNVNLYNNISTMSFSQPNEIYNKKLSIDLLFDNNDFFRIECDDCVFQLFE